MPSFDVVSRVDLAEVDNAIAGINREIATRFDFKGSKCTIARNEAEIALVADDELKLKQVHELLKVHLTRRKVEPGALDPDAIITPGIFVQHILQGPGYEKRVEKRTVRE